MTFYNSSCSFPVLGDSHRFLALCTIHVFFVWPILVASPPDIPVRPFPSCNQSVRFIHAHRHSLTNPQHSPRLKNTLLSPTFPLLLPRSLAVHKRKPARPLVRTRSLADPADLLSKQQRPSAKAEQHSIANHARGKSKAPPSYQLRVQVESSHSLERNSNSSRSLADLIARRLPSTSRRRAVVFAAAAALFAAARGRAGGR